MSGTAKAPACSADARRSFDLARRLRQPWEGRWQRLQDLAMPYRQAFAGNNKDGTPREPVSVYDSTGIVSIEEFANRLCSGIVPAGRQWARFEAERGADDRLRAGLQQVQDEVFRLLDGSNFHAEILDVFKDLVGPGQGCLRLSAGDWTMPVRSQAIPLADAWVTPGAEGAWADIHVRYRLPRYAVRRQWPGAPVPEKGRDERCKGEDQVEVIDTWLRDLESPTERWRQETHMQDGGLLLNEREHAGMGSCPYVFGRWSKSAGDLYAVGQGLLALPDLETLNEVSRLILAHADLGLSGMWQAEDDGVLNPWSVRLEPGTIIPIAPQSKGLQPLSHPGTKIDLGMMQLEERRHAIRKALYCEQLGAREGTPPTAFEIDTRMAELARQLGPTYHRVWQEMVVPILVRVRRVLIDAGRIRMPLLDGKEVRAVAASSMVRAQAVGDVQRVKAFMGDVQALFGPQAVAEAFSLEGFLDFARERYDVPGGIAFSGAQMKANAEAKGRALGQAAGAMGVGAAEAAPLLKAIAGGGAKRPGGDGGGGGSSAGAALAGLA